MNEPEQRLRELRLIEVARLYYEQEQSQQDIASRLHISRPLVSRMLRDARRLGIVRIEVIGASRVDERLSQQAHQYYGLSGVTLIEEGEDSTAVNRALAGAALAELRRLEGGCLGVGWGTVVGLMAELCEELPGQSGEFRAACSLVGDCGVSTRSYRCNENTRLIARHLGAEPFYLRIPAFLETARELELALDSEHYRTLLYRWERLDAVVLNIGNYPSVPDFASASRFGNLLVKGRAAGRLLAYYYDINGEIFHSEDDHSVQIPLELLRRCPKVIGLCAANVAPRALAGALRGGLLSHVVCTEELLRRALEYTGS